MSRIRLVRVSLDWHTVTARVPKSRHMQTIGWRAVNGSASFTVVRDVKHDLPYIASCKWVSEGIVILGRFESLQRAQAACERKANRMFEPKRWRGHNYADLRQRNEVFTRFEQGMSYDEACRSLAVHRNHMKRKVWG